MTTSENIQVKDEFSTVSTKSQNGDKKKDNFFTQLWNKWSFLPRSQKTSIISLAFLAIIVLPISTMVSLQRTKTRPRAETPVTPPVPPEEGFGPAAIFDGNSFIKIPYGFSMPNLGENFTIELRIQPDINHDNGLFTTLLHKEEAEYQLLLKQQPGDFASLYFTARDNVTNITLEGNTIFPIGGSNWYHIAVVKNDLNLRMYLNGKLDAETNLSANLTHNKESSVYVGAANQGSIEFYYGLIDELRISNFAKYSSPFSPPQDANGPDQYTRVLYAFDGNTQDFSLNNLPAIPFGNIQYTNTPTIPPTGLCPTTVTYPNADYYGVVTIDGSPAPMLTQIRIYGENNNLLGCANTTSSTGTLPFTTVYGATMGEALTFWVNNSVGNTTPEEVRFDGNRTRVDINVNTQPTPTPTPARLTPTPPPLTSLFSDDFESKKLNWSVISGKNDVKSKEEAAIIGEKGLEIKINTTRYRYLQDDTPNAETRYKASFYFDPNSITMANNDRQNIFSGHSTDTQVVAVSFRRFNGEYQLLGAYLPDEGLWKYTAWYTIADGPHLIELDYQTSPFGYISLYIDGQHKQTVSGIHNYTRTIDHVRLGPRHIDAGTKGHLYFDEFESFH